MDLSSDSGGFSCPPRLLLLHHLVLHPRDSASPPPLLPHSLQSLFLSSSASPALSLSLSFLSPFRSFPALAVSPSVPRFSLRRYLCLYTTASSTPFSLLFLLTVLLRVTLLLRATTTTITSPPPPPFPPSASWPSPPAESTCSLPHYLSNPALLSTNDQPLSLHRVPLFLRERNLSFLRSRAPLLSKAPSSRSYCSLAYERTKMKLLVLVSLPRSILKDSW